MAQQANHALPEGYRIEEYTITRQLSLGGFSIVYLATDAKDNRVAIKELQEGADAARDLGIHRQSLQQKMTALGLRRRESDPGGE